METELKHKSRIISQEVACEKKWLGIEHITYSIGDRIVKNYESTYRTTRKQRKSPIDGVEIIPIIKKKGKPAQLVFIANFRPSVGNFCLEFPAGLIDTQNYEQNAFRELKEETGYVAKKIVKVPVCPSHCDPWKSNETGILYMSIIDGDDPDHYQKQELQVDQNIRVLTLPIDSNLTTALQSLAKQHNYVIHTKASICLLLCLSDREMQRNDMHIITDQQES